MPRAAGKLLALLLALLLAVGFGTLGLMAGAWPMVQMAQAAWRAPARQAAAAEVIESRLERTRRSVQLHARFRYRWDGRTWESDQVGIAPAGPFGASAWRLAWHQQLQAALAEDRRLTAWVDPAAPGNAVLDRAIPWNKAAFHVPFAVVFTPLGLAAAAVFVLVLLTPAHRLPTPDALAGHPDVRRVARWMTASCWFALSAPVVLLLWMQPAPLWLRLAATGAMALGGWKLWALARLVPLPPRKPR